MVAAHTRHGGGFNGPHLDYGRPLELSRATAICLVVDAKSPKLWRASLKGHYPSVAPLLNADVEKMDDMIALNITALTRLAYAAAPAFVARAAGVLNNLSSVLALAPERFNASYSATKAYILNFSLTLHQELSPSGVQVQVVLPGATRTAIWARAGIEVASLPASRLMEVDEMVDAALVGLDRRELVTIPSLPDIADWEAYTAARLHLGPNLSLNHAADRYKTVDSTRPSRAR